MSLRSSSWPSRSACRMRVEVALRALVLAEVVGRPCRRTGSCRAACGRRLASARGRGPRRCGAARAGSTPTLEPSDSPPSCSALTGELQQPVADVSAARRMSSVAHGADVGGLGGELGRARRDGQQRLEVGRRPWRRGRAAPPGPRRERSPRPAVVATAVLGVGAVSVSGGSVAVGGANGCGALLESVIGVSLPLRFVPPGPDPLTLLTRGQSTSFPGGAVHLFGIVACTGRWPRPLALPPDRGQTVAFRSPPQPCLPSRPPSPAPGERPPRSKEPSVEPI